MKLSDKNLLELSKIAITAATEAGQLIRRYAGKQVKTQHKAGASSIASQVVTEVDLKSQELILKIIKPSTEKFDLALLTEESEDDGGRLEKDYFWCIDPLDGTLPFTEAVPGYSVSIALVSHAGIPEIGVIYDPLTETLYHAVSGQGAFRNNQSWKLSSPNPGKELTFHADRSFLSNKLFDAAMEELRTIALKKGCQGLEIVENGGGALYGIWTLENAPACYFKFPKNSTGGGCLWDFSASACICRELGASVSDIHGNPLDLNRKDSVYMNHRGILFASDQKLAEEIIGMYRRVTESSD